MNEPKKLYVGIYYQPKAYAANSGKPIAQAGYDGAFKRAAETYQRNIETSNGFRQGVDQVKLFQVTTDEGFIKAWLKVDAYAREHGYQVQELSTFTHANHDKGNNKPGLAFAAIRDYKGDKDHTLTAGEISNLPRLPWSKDAVLYLNGSNTGNSRMSPTGWTVASEFAKTQQVTTVGFQAHSSFSTSPERYHVINDKAKDVYLLSFARGGHDPVGMSKSQTALEPASLIRPLLWDKDGKQVPAGSIREHWMIATKGIALGAPTREHRNEFHQEQKRRQQEQQEQRDQQQKPQQQQQKQPPRQDRQREEIPEEMRSPTKYAMDYRNLKDRHQRLTKEQWKQNGYHVDANASGVRVRLQTRDGRRAYTTLYGKDDLGLSSAQEKQKAVDTAMETNADNARQIKSQQSRVEKSQSASLGPG